MKTEKKHTTRKKIKVIREVIVKEGDTKIIYRDLIKIDEKLSDNEGIHLIDAIMEKCPAIVLKLLELLLTISDK
jgi:hypothetical protein